MVSPPGAMRFKAPEGSIPTLEIPDLSRFRWLHLVGVGGAGMGGIARLLLARGFVVSGSDLKDSRALGELRSAGATAYAGHAAEQLDPKTDAVVISTAIPERNPELLEARRRGLPVLARAQVLAGLAEGKRTFAVSGTHGKTTTTSMLSVIVDHAGLDPTFVIGGDLNEIGSGARHGSGDVFVAEADESDGSFLLLRPEVGVITNVEEDHLDFYGKGADIEAAFGDFAASADEVVACGDDPGTQVALRMAGRGAVRYGVGPGNDARLRVLETGTTHVRGTLDLGTNDPIEVELRVPGIHNLLNAGAAILAAGFAGVEPATAAHALGEFSGVRRRFEYRGSAGGAEFYDDYAHHPTEVAATLAAAASGAGDRRVVAVFQPHRYSRTQALWRGLGESLAGADVVVVTDVYAAGEDPVPGISGKLLVDALAAVEPGKRIEYVPHRADVVSFLAREVRPGDLVLTLGAGDVTMVAGETLERIRERT